jgi:hypothetical protein
MKADALPAALACMALLATPPFSGCARAAPPAAKPPKLEQMAYPSARKVILGYGWRPVSGPCQLRPETCAQFPEIEACSGTGLGYCAMVFVRKDKCLFIRTTGGEPLVAHEDETQVDHVSFRAGPCRRT